MTYDQILSNLHEGHAFMMPADLMIGSEAILHAQACRRHEPFSAVNLLPSRISVGKNLAERQSACCKHMLGCKAVYSCTFS